MPKLTINGKTVEVKEGSSIMEAYKQLDEDICYYCWHPGLSIAGVCRLCMVEIEGNPKMQIACNTTVQDGMVVHNNSDKVKEAVKWGLDFHLINHPLDCPICDQAGECGLQDQYMKFGKYNPEMAERKVKKRKVVDLGERVVLDTERCILCSRCVRFTDEVSKTHELGIFNRGDRSEIGTFEDKPLDNNYSLNTVDICPVGALTSKDFRFRQRVWYLKDNKTICPGCSTGCSVKAFYNEEGVFRLQPDYNPEVNGYWMCDKGRDTYKQVNRDTRLARARVGQNGVWESQSAGAAAKSASEILKSTDSDKLALVLTGQYTNEEYQRILEVFVNELKCKTVVHWQNLPDQLNEFDGLLMRGDRNPNTKGLQESLKKFGVGESWESFTSKIKDFEMVVVAGPENLAEDVYPDLQDKIEKLSQVANLVWLTADKNTGFEKIKTNAWLIPQKTFVEKAGSYINYAGLNQEFNVVTTIIAGALNLGETADLLSGKEVGFSTQPAHDISHLKKNYFVEQRGRL